MPTQRNVSRQTQSNNVSQRNSQSQTNNQSRVVRQSTGTPGSPGQVVSASNVTGNVPDAQALIAQILARLPGSFGDYVRQTMAGQNPRPPLPQIDIPQFTRPPLDLPQLTAIRQQGFPQVDLPQLDDLRQRVTPKLPTMGPRSRLY
mgnify:FL=1